MRVDNRIALFYQGGIEKRSVLQVNISQLTFVSVRRLHIKFQTYPLLFDLRSHVFPGLRSIITFFLPSRIPGFRRIDTDRSEEHTSELQSRENLVCRLLLEKKKNA